MGAWWLSIANSTVHMLECRVHIDSVQPATRSHFVVTEHDHGHVLTEVRRVEGRVGANLKQKGWFLSMC